MAAALEFLDQLLRRRDDLGTELLDADAARRCARQSLLWLALLGAAYGLVMGAYAGLQGGSWGYLGASALKVPLLLAATTLVCFPALYVFGIAGGAGVRPGSLLAALLSAQAVLTLALAALLPVVLFFISTTHNYQFVKLLHVAAWSVAGVLALAYLRRLLRQLDPRLGGNRRLLLLWMLLFGLVGSQMGWMMRPFISRRGEPFVAARAVSSNVYANLLKSGMRLVLNRHPHGGDRARAQRARAADGD